MDVLTPVGRGQRLKLQFFELCQDEGVDVRVGPVETGGRAPGVRCDLQAGWGAVRQRLEGPEAALGQQRSHLRFEERLWGLCDGGHRERENWRSENDREGASENEPPAAGAIHGAGGVG